MECWNTIHILVDTVDAGKISPWIANVNGTNGNILVHDFDFPNSVSAISHSHHGRAGYILQAWAMMWADRFTNITGAEFVMFLDTDVVFAMPVTCRSLFDEEGRVYQLSWSIAPQIGFKHSCESLLKATCSRSYMTVLPFTMPVDALPVLREYISRHLLPGSSTIDFDAAFNKWSLTHDWKAFSQFVVMGEFMRTHLSAKVRQVHCPNAAALSREEMETRFSLDAETSACRNYVPVAVHYGWLPQGYLGVGGGEDAFSPQKENSLGEFQRYSKFNIKTIDAVQEIVWHGRCLQALFAAGGGGALPRHCNKLGVTSPAVHAFVDLYHRRRTLDWQVVAKTFSPSPAGLCARAIQ